MYGEKSKTLQPISEYNGFQLNKGFSFVELLIVIVTMSLIFTVGFANYRTFQRRKAVEAFATQIKADLNLTREYALSGRKPASGCAALNGYMFTIDYLAGSYSLSPRCDGYGFAPIKTVVWPSGVAMSTSLGYLFGGEGSINFKTLGTGTEVVDSSGSGTLPVTITVGSTIQMSGWFCTNFPWYTWWPFSCGSQYLDSVTFTISQTGVIQ
jgi:type II secretory pathway pseudopilin PulG